MRRTRFVGSFVAATLILILRVSNSYASIPPRISVPGSHNVLTHHNDPQRTGRMLSETILTPAAIFDPANQGANFGRLFSQSVDGFVYGKAMNLNLLFINYHR